MATYYADSVGLKGRTNDTFTFSIDVGYAIGARVPKMFIGSIDMSSYCTVTGANTILININASKMTLLGAGVHRYDILLEIDADNNDVLFSGSLTIAQGITP